MKQLIVLSLMCLILSSCGKNLTVNLAETALLWRVDDYFDIDKNQRKDLKSNFRQALKQVNDEIIPEFEKVIFSEALITKECVQVEKSYYELKPQFEQLRIRFLKRSFSFIDSVNPKQVEYFIEQTNKEIAKDEKKSNSDRVNASEKRLKRTQSTLQELFGDLTAPQQQSVQTHVLEQKSYENFLIESRKKNINVLQNKSVPEAKQYLKNYVIQWRDFHTAELKAAVLEREVRNEKFFLDFFCTASVKQKKHFQTTVADYLNLFRKVYLAQK